MADSTNTRFMPLQPVVEHCGSTALLCRENPGPTTAAAAVPRIPGVVVPWCASHTLNTPTTNGQDSRTGLALASANASCVPQVARAPPRVELDRYRYTCAPGVLTAITPVVVWTKVAEKHKQSRAVHDEFFCESAAFGLNRTWCNQHA